MLKKMLSQQKQDPLDFFPELNLYTTSTNDGSTFLNIRFFSGDEKNNNKNLKIRADDIQEISLSVEDFELNHPIDPRAMQILIEGKSFLVIKRFDVDEPEKYLLAEHRVKALPVSCGKKGPVWLSAAEILQEINFTLQDEFGAALEEFEQESTGGSESVRAEPKRSGKRFDINKLVIAICVVISLVALTSIGKKIFTGGTNPANSQTIYDAAANAPVIQEAKKSEINPEDEALMEFGLEKGIDLEK